MHEMKKEKIDLIRILFQWVRMIRHTWWVFLLLCLMTAGLSIIRMRYFYVPLYRASAFFSVDSGSNAYYSDYTTSVTLDQLSATFPYILESGALRKTVCEDLDMETLPGTITASAVESTNLFQINVTCEDPETARKILASVIKNYPAVARYIIGDTTLHMLDQEDGVNAPVNPVSVKKETAKALLAAVCVYGFLLLILTLTHHTVVGEEDLKHDVHIRCLAMIPKTWMKKRSHQKAVSPIINDQASASFTEAFHTLAVRVLRQLKKGNYQTVLVTSCRENEGKTTTAVNLALTCAAKGYHTLLIDGDFRNPSVLRQLQIAQKTSSKDSFSGDHFAENILFHHYNAHLDVLGNRQSLMAPQVSTMLNASAIQTFLDHCRQKYDCIFIDTPPCSMLQDAMSFARCSDCTLFVIRQDYTDRESILNSLEVLSDTGSTIIGYTMSFASRSSGGYGYGTGKYGRYGSASEKGDVNYDSM